MSSGSIRNGGRQQRVIGTGGQGQITQDGNGLKAVPGHGTINTGRRDLSAAKNPEVINGGGQGWGWAAPTGGGRRVNDAQDGGFSRRAGGGGGEADPTGVEGVRRVLAAGVGLVVAPREGGGEESKHGRRAVEVGRAAEGGAGEEAALWHADEGGADEACGVIWREAKEDLLHDVAHQRRHRHWTEGKDFRDPPVGGTLARDGWNGTAAWCGCGGGLNCCAGPHCSMLKWKARSEPVSVVIVVHHDGSPTKGANVGPTDDGWNSWAVALSGRRVHETRAPAVRDATVRQDLLLHWRRGRRREGGWG
ncbi:hypothetical protein BRADI_1g58596v3 [Brachypodium distachyon]|uniref:Uncharacterized protein n=1 Tax=Brachypodium distachyon TaxID=15368 RepID=A0A0Q3NUB2_BRADI|nr:hypothetical protein BRADI_1g58596v3 [Brachypodium distachyon]